MKLLNQNNINLCKIEKTYFDNKYTNILGNDMQIKKNENINEILFTDTIEDANYIFA